MKLMRRPSGAANSFANPKSADSANDSSSNDQKPEKREHSSSPKAGRAISDMDKVLMLPQAALLTLQQRSEGRMGPPSLYSQISMSDRELVKKVPKPMKRQRSCPQTFSLLDTAARQKSEKRPIRRRTVEGLLDLESSDEPKEEEQEKEEEEDCVVSLALDVARGVLRSSARSRPSLITAAPQKRRSAPPKASPKVVVTPPKKRFSVPPKASSPPKQIITFQMKRPGVPAKASPKQAAPLPIMRPSLPAPRQVATPGKKRPSLPPKSTPRQQVLPLATKKRINAITSLAVTGKSLSLREVSKVKPSLAATGKSASLRAVTKLSSSLGLPKEAPSGPVNPWILQLREDKTSNNNVAIANKLIQKRKMYAKSA